MTEAERNLALVKEAYRRWNEEKETAFDCWMDLFAEDIDDRSIGLN